MDQTDHQSVRAFIDALFTRISGSWVVREKQIAPWVYDVEGFDGLVIRINTRDPEHWDAGVLELDSPARPAGPIRTPFVPGIRFNPQRSESSLEKAIERNLVLPGRAVMPRMLEMAEQEQKRASDGFQMFLALMSASGVVLSTQTIDAALRDIQEGRGVTLRFPVLDHTYGGQADISGTRVRLSIDVTDRGLAERLVRACARRTVVPPADVYPEVSLVEGTAGPGSGLNRTT